MTDDGRRNGIAEPQAGGGASVVVCAYTQARWQDLCETIASLLAQRPEPVEIILVIDNNAALLEQSRRHFTQVRVVPNRHGRGLSGARNTGIEEARGALVAFIDDDATIAPDVIAKLAAAALRPGTLGATANIRPDWIGARPSWFPDEYLWTVGCTHEPAAGRVIEVRNVTGAACLFRREVFAACGSFSQALGRGKGRVPISCEETELCIRARQQFPGQAFLRDETALVQHKVPAARLTWRYFLIRCYAEGLSKGRLRAMLPSGAAFGTERSYVLSVLLPATAKAVVDGLKKPGAGAFTRAAAIMLGLAAATLGYAGAMASDRKGGGRVSGEPDAMTHR